jgi:hypothetical protein
VPRCRVASNAPAPGGCREWHRCVPRTAARRGAAAPRRPGSDRARAWCLAVTSERSRRALARSCRTTTCGEEGSPSTRRHQAVLSGNAMLPPRRVIAASARQRRKHPPLVAAPPQAATPLVAAHSRASPPPQPQPPAPPRWRQSVRRHVQEQPAHLPQVHPPLPQCSPQRARAQPAAAHGGAVMPGMPSMTWQS